jgi:hypothetical protein
VIGKTTIVKQNFIENVVKDEIKKIKVNAISCRRKG